MTTNWKEQYDNYSKRLPFYDLKKWYEKEGNNNYASLNIGVFRGWLSIRVGVDLKQDVKNRDKWSNISIPMDIAYTTISMIQQFIKNGDKDYLKIPIVKSNKDDKGKTIRDSTTTLAHIVIGKNEKEYYFGILFPQKTNVHFILHPSMPGKQWLIAKKDSIVDTLEISKVYALNYFNSLQKDLDKVKEEMTVLFNKMYPTTITGSKQPASETTSATDTNNIDVSELDMDML